MERFWISSGRTVDLWIYIQMAKANNNIQNKQTDQEIIATDNKKLWNEKKQIKERA